MCIAIERVVKAGNYAGRHTAQGTLVTVTRSGTKSKPMVDLGTTPPTGFLGYNAAKSGLQLVAI
jgi:hypothetical protein